MPRRWPTRLYIVTFLIGVIYIPLNDFVLIRAFPGDAAERLLRSTDQMLDPFAVVIGIAAFGLGWAFLTLVLTGLRRIDRIPHDGLPFHLRFLRLPAFLRWPYPQRFAMLLGVLVAGGATSSMAITIVAGLPGIGRAFGGLCQAAGMLLAARSFANSSSDSTERHLENQ